MQFRYVNTAPHAGILNDFFAENVSRIPCDEVNIVIIVSKLRGFLAETLYLIRSFKIILKSFDKIRRADTLIVKAERANGGNSV